LGEIALPKKDQKMKATRLTYFLAIGLTLAFAATGCKHKPVDVTRLPPGKTGVADPNAAGGVADANKLRSDEIGTPLPEDLNDLSKFDQLREILAPHTVHFDYDSAAIRSSEREHVQAVADYMKGAAGMALLIEGHCDERGTEEYNRALGERRALALREALIQLGADGGKMTTRSFGKDKKIDLGNDEASHARNRRGEFVVLRPK
jgi:peptidoglycan-associated lipoprotein